MRKELKKEKRMLSHVLEGLDQMLDLKTAK